MLSHRIVKRYEPESYLVQFYKVEPEDKVGIITVQCSNAAKGSTRIQVTYRYVAPGKMGEEFVPGFGSDEYEAFIEEWKNLLVGYFGSTG
ncbi:MAG: hypothetical protein JW821_17085 [Deltaproteobacteria bacterium]|nr:hypothetical protein [Deltaproteobacteria bacterium]